MTRNRNRAAVRKDWLSLAPGRSLKWWAAFAFNVKATRTRHSDRAKLRLIRDAVDGQYGRRV